MKKTIYFLIFILTFFMQIEVNAEEYKISDLNMTLSFEKEWIVFTRDNYKDNQNLKDFDITEEQMKTLFTTKNAYVDAVDKNGIELFIRATGTKLEKNLYAYKDKELKSYVNSIMDEKNANNYKFIKNNNIKYVVLSYIDKKMEYHILEAHTIVDKKAITITYQFPKEFTEDQKRNFESILESIKIDFIDISRNKKDINTPMILGGIIVTLGFIIGYKYLIKKKKQQAN